MSYKPTVFNHSFAYIVMLSIILYNNFHLEFIITVVKLYVDPVYSGYFTFYVKCFKMFTSYTICKMY